MATGIGRRPGRKAGPRT